MTLDLIFNVVLLIASIYCFIYIGGVDNSTSTRVSASGSSTLPATRYLNSARFAPVIPFSTIFDTLFLLSFNK